LITEHYIETEWSLSKILVTNLRSFKVFLYLLPQYGLYLQSLRPIPTYLEDAPPGPRILFENSRTPHIATVRTLDPDNVIEFIHANPDFKMSKVFKHGMYHRDFTRLCVGGLAKNTVKNMMGLFPGETFRIVSTSKTLRDIFYEDAVLINQENNFSCEFDYDEYDYVLEIRPYKRYKDGKFHSWAIVTVLHGDSLPNTWKYGQ